MPLRQGAGAPGRGGRDLGPKTSTFGTAATANRGAAEALRDAYANANAAWLAQYNADKTFLIALQWTGGGEAIQRRNTAGTAWEDVTDIIRGPQGTPAAPAVNVYQRFSADNAAWHPTFQSGDQYTAFATGTARPADDNAAWSAGVRFVGTDGTDGMDGSGAGLTDIEQGAPRPLWPVENTFYRDKNYTPPQVIYWDGSGDRTTEGTEPNDFTAATFTAAETLRDNRASGTIVGIDGLFTLRSGTPNAGQAFTNGSLYQNHTTRRLFIAANDNAENDRESQILGIVGTKLRIQNSNDAIEYTGVARSVGGDRSAGESGSKLIGFSYVSRTIVGTELQQPAVISLRRSDPTWLASYEADSGKSIELRETTNHTSKRQRRVSGAWADLTPIGWRTVGSIEFVDAFPATADAKRGVVYVRRDTLAAMALGVTTAAVRESVTTAAASTEGTSYKGVHYNIYNVPNVAIGDMFFDPDEAEYRAGENKLYDGSLQLVVNSQPSADDANVGNLRTVFGSSSEWVGRARDGTILITSDASHPCIGQFDNEAQVAQALQSVASQVQSGKNYYYFDRGLNQLRYVSAFTAMSAEVLGLRNFPSTGGQGEGGAGGVGGAGASQASAIAYAQVANNASAPAIGSPAYNGTAWTVATGWSLTEPTPSTTTDIFALVLQATPPGEGESAWNVVNFGAQRIYAGTTQGNFAFQYSIDVGVTWTIAKPTNFGMGEGHYVRVLGSNGQWSPPIYSGHATALQWFIGEFETTGHGAAAHHLERVPAVAVGLPRGADDHHCQR